MGEECGKVLGSCATLFLSPRKTGLIRCKREG